MKTYVQGEPAAEGNLELVHVREPSKQHRRDEGVRAQEQESVAGVVVVVRRGVITAGARSEAGKSLKLNLVPHGPFRVPTYAPPLLFATAPPCLGGARRTPTSQLGSAAAARSVDRVGARAALATLAGSSGPTADAGEPLR